MGVHAQYVLPFDALQNGHNWDRVPTTTQHNAPKPICPVLDRVGREWCGSGATCWAEGTVSPSPAVPKRPMMGEGQTEGIRSSPPCSLSRAKGTKPAGLVAPIGGSGGGMSHCHLWGRRWQRVSGWVLAAGGTGTTRICHPNLKATRKKKKTPKDFGEFQQMWDLSCKLSQDGGEGDRPHVRPRPNNGLQPLPLVLPHRTPTLGSSHPYVHHPTSQSPSNIKPTPHTWDLGTWCSGHRGW